MVITKNYEKCDQYHVNKFFHICILKSSHTKFGLFQLLHITFYIKVSFQMPIVIFDNKQRLTGISGQADRTAGAASQSFHT